MSAGSRTSYSTHPGATPEAELSALASIYAFAIRKAEEAQKSTGGHENIARAIEGRESLTPHPIPVGDERA